MVILNHIVIKKRKCFSCQTAKLKKNRVIQVVFRRIFFRLKFGLRRANLRDFCVGPEFFWRALFD